MSDTNNPYVQSFYNHGINQSSSQNAGAWEARNGYGCSGQQHNESFDAWQNRVGQYNHEKSK